ncbi:MAG: hypothetical protein CMH31_00055 [Micavibrio sp.]|nr:hypothetical protein [Micavibrio sp.]
MTKTLVFAHGWGSAPFVWKDMIDAFSDYDYHMINMGFLGEEDLTVPTGKFIGIGHSLGGSWLLKHYADQMEGFVSISSFNCFYKHISTHFLSTMKHNITKDSMKQLTDFWHHAGLDYKDGFKELNSTKLIEGLTWLSKWESKIPDTLPIRVLSSHDDKIVPEKMTIDIWGNHNIDWVDDGGHMLPLTQSKWCCEKIKEFLDDL